MHLQTEIKILIHWFLIQFVVGFRRLRRNPRWMKRKAPPGHNNPIVLCYHHPIRSLPYPDSATSEKKHPLVALQSIQLSS